MSAVKLVALTRRFGSTAAVAGMDLHIPARSYCYMLGPSGRGKTTTRRLSAGHKQATDGDIVIGGQNVTDLAPPSAAPPPFSKLRSVPAPNPCQQRRLGPQTPPCPPRRMPPPLTMPDSAEAIALIPDGEFDPVARS